MSTYSNLINPPVSPNPVLSPAPGREDAQVQNNTGGFVFSVTPENRLLRFLVLGADSATYYASKENHFRQAYGGVEKAIIELGVRAVEIITEVSVAGRAPKQDATLFALALCAAKGTPEVRAAAIQSINKVCRIPTHLFSFLTDYKSLGGKTGGRAIKRALQNWYLEKTPASLAYSLVKYRHRGGWEHKDVLRLCKPVTGTLVEHGDLFRWAVGKPVILDNRLHMQMIFAHEAAKEASLSDKDLAELITKFGLPREGIPDARLSSPEVWRALLMPSPKEKGGMPLTALIRNLNRMTIAGLFGLNSDETMYAISRLTDREEIKKARVHPIQFLSAARTYANGRGEKGSLTWEPNPQITAALEEGFVLAFDFVERTNKRYYIGLDVSGSMGSGDIAGVPGLTPRDASAAMALLWSKTEPACIVKGFTSDGSGYWDNRTTLTDLTGVFLRDSLQKCIAGVSDLPFGGTQPALIIEDALKNKIPVDVFVILTDNEVNSGEHPFKRLQEYRKVMGIDAKMVVIGMTATEFTLADPSDAGMLDVIGFDAAAPSVVSDFVTGGSK